MRSPAARRRRRRGDCPAVGWAQACSRQVGGRVRLTASPGSRARSIWSAADRVDGRLDLLPQLSRDRRRAGVLRGRVLALGADDVAQVAP